VVVHDAARPLASVDLFRAVVDATRAGAEAAVPAVDLTDTIRRRDGGVVDRSELVAVQTPQAFSAAVLRRAHAAGLDATDDAGLVEASGGKVTLVAGETTNLKITNPEDLARAEAVLAGGEETPPAVAVGQGFDVHRFSDDPARRLVLGGVHFEGSPGLAGHSDADVIAHACTDALLGAAGLGDIGQLFPDTDPAYAGADSLALLAEAVRRVRAAGWSPGNVDCSVVLEAPKLAPRRAEIQDRLSGVVGAPVTVKGKRAEGLGTLGRREGIACWAVAIVTRR
jgi:2-C-methyl-D-erythritol 2,4-cyclodiphosphate synthase